MSHNFFIAPSSFRHNSFSYILSILINYYLTSTLLLLPHSHFPLQNNWWTHKTHFIYQIIPNTLDLETSPHYSFQANHIYSVLTILGHFSLQIHQNFSPAEGCNPMNFDHLGNKKKWLHLFLLKTQNLVIHIWDFQQCPKFKEGLRFKSFYFFLETNKNQLRWCVGC